MTDEQENIAQTVAREARKPMPLGEFIAVPSEWNLVDIERTLPTPRRKTAKIMLNDADSFIDYIKRHGSLGSATVWCQVDYAEGNVEFASILNDNGEEETQPHWRDHVARFKPEFSEEWNRWFGKDKNVFSQGDFAAFIEENLKDVASIDGSPSGTQMLEMALAFEANQELRFKSTIRLENGAVQLNFANNDDAATLQKMQMFERFTIGIPVFWSGDAYQMSARLRYRARDGRVSFWFELIRADKVLEDATETLVQKIMASTGMPFFYGNPFAA